MWRPSLNFVTLHYVYIVIMGLMGLAVLYPYGNLSAVDSYFFGVSSSTESGLNTVDLKLLKTYQQLFMYFVPMLTNLAFVNIIVVVVRLWWFQKHLTQAAPHLRQPSQRPQDGDLEVGTKSAPTTTPLEDQPTLVTATGNDGCKASEGDQTKPQNVASSAQSLEEQLSVVSDEKNQPELEPRITFDPSTNLHPRRDAALYIPGPRDRDQGQPLVELRDGRVSREDLRIEPIVRASTAEHPTLRRRRLDGPLLSEARSMDRVAVMASSMFILGHTESRKERRPSLGSPRPTQAMGDFPQLSREVTVGRNSVFHNMTSDDREQLGGIEYRSLKLLLKIVLSYFFGIHIFGFILLLGWIQYANPKYSDYIEECGQNKNWWAFYTAQTMTSNLGFTLTPDSMISFNDAPAPMLMMSFSALAGHTFYPIFLRLLIWTMSKLAPRRSSIQEPLSFLLNHPRRCYTLLFPSGPTWALVGILMLLNIVDIVLIIVLDLDNAAVAYLPGGQRLAAAIFQSVSSRHTGTASFNLAAVNPAVQLSLLVMMYISAYPIAIAIRSSNTYEERSLGLYQPGSDEEERSASYLLTHVRNQLSFDLWFIFVGIFAICVKESSHIMDNNDPAFTVFPILFEVVSAYGNVGLSLGYPGVSTSFCSQFSPFSKVVLCAMMLRGRHRGLPYALDRAIVLPNENAVWDDDSDAALERPRSRVSALAEN
ncbi:cation transport protein-domain-containing protein [Dactylonectria macrodidyma]|uniref:Potassium transport protein n=1 Tax=Dactylonectria macrodidyma TaxID=307937 RepID=A0A9P9DYZ1_9HYPO|nr:cation transport protein-domain-containing protein [Dactylonectria macrodidyma]